MISFRVFSTRSLWVRTTMPGVTGVEQAAIRDRAPATSTRQMRQEPVGVASLRWQSVGISIPALREASRIVCPGLKVVSISLRVKVVLFMGGSFGDQVTND